MISALIGLGIGLSYMFIGIRIASPRFVQRDVQKMLDKVLSDELAKHGPGRFIPVSEKNSLAVEERRAWAAGRSMAMVPFWPIYMAWVSTKEYLVKNPRPTTYDVDKVKADAEKRSAEYEKTIADLEAQDAKWRERYANAAD